MKHSFRMHRAILASLPALLPLTLHAQVEYVPESEPAQHRALWSADHNAAQAAWSSSFASAILARMADSVVVLIEGAPIVRGRAEVERLLNAQRYNPPLQTTWEPLRVILSRDLTLGVTFGTTLHNRGAAAPIQGRYVSVWQRGPDRNWRIVAHVQNGLVPQGAVLPDGIARAKTMDPHDPFADADRAFAQMARDSTAPAAFGHFAAPDAVTFGGAEFNIGPGTIRRRMTENGAGNSSWRWWPVITIAAPSGDLGATIGEAEITQTGGNAFVSKYLTVWMRQPDGSIRYLVDAGNARPRP